MPFAPITGDITPETSGSPTRTRSNPSPPPPKAIGACSSSTTPPLWSYYEVQVEAEGRRRGLGQRVLRVLEKLAHSTRMRYVRLTALTHNPSATAFFKACGYSLDETSPSKEEATHYEILSKATLSDSETDQRQGDEDTAEKMAVS
ncbi:unnamed protein product, partial [Iphiclides podalirius]